MSDLSPSTSASKARYVLIMPVRDEEKYIGAMIESVLAQKVHPAKWIIVDDGSRDKTTKIIESYVRRVDFLETVRLPTREHRKPGGEGAISHALNRLNLVEYDFLARFDADLVFEPDYITRILEEFDRDPKLGIAGGGLYITEGTQYELEKVPEYHVRGALKMYRRECFEQIGGLTTEIGWDTIDEVYAWMKGWKTRSFFHHRVIHLRPTGKGVRSAHIYWERGKAEYYTWSHPVFVLGKTGKLAAEKFSLLKPLAFLAGFFSCYLRRESRIQDPAFVKTRRRQQRNRIVSLINPQPEKHTGLKANGASRVQDAE